MDNNGYYEILQVSQRASVEVMESARKALLAKHQPRAIGDSDRVAKKINEAYVVLSNPVARAKYDGSAPNTLGNYELVEEIGEGGFGRTYKARHVFTQEWACVKDCFRVAPELDDILINEAKAMWDLRHYAIPVVRDLVRTSEGSLALITSYIPSTDMDKYILKHGKLDPEYVVSIGDRILNALRYIHMHGVIHGDLKPGNILLQPEERMAVLCDFGLAAIKPKSTSKSIGYTPVFSPPEEKSGKPLLPESDLYSLGMALIYALSGDIKATEKMEVPGNVPDVFCDFLIRMTKQNILDRPSWHKNDICEEYTKMRIAAFGRRHSRT